MTTLWQHHLTRISLALAAMASLTAPAAAVRIDLNDIAPDRIERQRNFAAGRPFLPDTPDPASLNERLVKAGIERGSPVLIRIFKAESEIEIWMKKADRFVKFAKYPICHWSGSLGPKREEGDRQNPEGFYTVTRRQIHHSGRWPTSINIGFPNALDRTLKRTGSYILIHGGCTSVGCYAMTDAAAREIVELVRQTLRSGTPRVHVHAFPFHMTNANLARHKASPWQGFWLDLKKGYDAFAKTGLPPRVSQCGGRYIVEASETYSEPVGAEPRHKGRRGRYLRSARSAFPPSVACTDQTSTTQAKAAPAAAIADTVTSSPLP